MAITQAPPPSAPPPPEEEHAPGDKEMTLLEHLEELRGRLTAAMIALVVGVLIAVIPIPTLNSITGILVDLFVAQAKQYGVIVQVIKPGEAFFTYLEVALVVGAGLAMPVIIYQLMAFVTPALYAHEKRYLYMAVPGVFFSFLCGVTFCYFLTLPFATRFLAGFLSGTVAQQWSFAFYIDFVATFLFWVGVMFELPIIMFFLSKIGVVSHQRLAGFRKYAFVLAFVIGAAITPTPDPINQTIISLPIYLLFELGVILARFVTDTAGGYHSSADWPEAEPVPGVKRRVLSCGDEVMVVQFTIEAGADVPAHTHPHEQVGHVVSGRMKFRIGDEVRELGPGEGYSVPGGVTHGATGITRVVAVDSFHPVREDYR